jgi:hypothetical protein
MATRLLNDDGRASMATAMMSSHHGFRRDLACFARALSDGSRAAQVAEEWTKFHAALHGHHTVEDTAVFPDFRARKLGTVAELDTLAAQHLAIDPLLERGDRAFADPSRAAEALGVVRELDRALAEHLELEERVVIPHLREARDFPPVPNDEVAAMYAEGFAWATAGLAPEVCAALDAMLQPAVSARLPDARRAFAERCERVWGHRHTSASLTSVPDTL